MKTSAEAMGIILKMYDKIIIIICQNNRKPNFKTL